MSSRKIVLHVSIELSVSSLHYCLHLHYLIITHLRVRLIRNLETILFEYIKINLIVSPQSEDRKSTYSRYTGCHFRTHCFAACRCHRCETPRRPCTYPPRTCMRGPEGGKSAGGDDRVQIAI